MGRPLFLDVLDKPITSAVILACSTIWLYIQKRGVGYGDVGISYDAVAAEGQHWRLASAAMSHISFLHLVFNMSALWGLGGAEAALGPVAYLRNTLLLLLLSGLLALAMYHVLIVRFRLDHFKRVTAVGYSGVVFGWMTVLAVRQPSFRLPLLGGALSLPISLAPFESLALTSLLVPQASFVGHLGGILAGYMLGWGLFQDMSPYWTLTCTMWLCIGLVVSLKRASPLEMPFLTIEAVAETDVPPVGAPPAAGGGPPGPPARAADELV